MRRKASFLFAFMKTLVRTLLCVCLFLIFLKNKAAVAGEITSKNDYAIVREILSEYVNANKNVYDEWCEAKRKIISLDPESYDVLCRIVEAEATGGTVEQKRNVASCVLTRVASPNWPDTVKGVVFDGIQFSPTIDGRYYSVSITDSTIEAVNLTLQEGLMHDCEYFCTKSSYEKPKSWHRNALTYIFYDGIHVYCN